MSNVKRWAGEFVAIVLGVLVALAVDDWREYSQEREIEEHLIERLTVDLSADSSDLAVAVRQVSSRLWVLNQVSSEHEHWASPPDSLFGRGGGGPQAILAVDPVERPLATFQSWPDFDLSDDSYREMVATGSLDLIRDADLRSSIVAYYRTAADQGENERRVGQYQDAFEEALTRIGVSVGDPITLPELKDRVAADPSMLVEVRRAANRIQLQLRYYGTIERQRATFRKVLTDLTGAPPGTP